MDPSFGVRLRSERERQRIALETIADRTKIKLALLQALERDDVSQWPHGIFRRSHVRAYAQAIGLDPDVVVREFLEVHPDPAEEIPAILEATQQASGESANRAPKTRIGLLVDSALEAVRSRPRERTPSGDSVAAPADGAAAAARPTSPSDIERELTSLADLCARIGRAHDLQEVVPVLEEASGLIDAVGLVLWRWDQEDGVLTPVLALGYSNEMVARLATVPRDADNAIGAAFRSAETQGRRRHGCRDRGGGRSCRDRRRMRRCARPRIAGARRAPRVRARGRVDPHRPTRRARRVRSTD